MNYLAVFIGSGLGGISRFAVSAFVGHRIVGNFPWNILSVNLIGAFLIGVISELLALKYSESLNMNYLLIAGFLGGFTTFSAFSLEGALMWMKGDYLSLGSYIFASVFGTILLVFVGMRVARLFIGA